MEIVPEGSPTFLSRFLPETAPARRCCNDLATQGWAAPDGLGSTPRLDINAEVAVHLHHLDRQVNLTLIDMSGSGARLRTGVMLPPQAGLSFRWMGPSRFPILVH